MKKPLILIVLILLIDQILKVWIKTTFSYGEEVNLIGDWCRLHFIENKGMAFGMAFGGDAGKIILTTLRIVASVIIFIYMRRLVAKGAKKIVIYSFAFIFCGAIGNVIDSIFYGVLFSESTIFSTAVFLPESGGYAPLFLGKVVDMFYFPLIDTVLPEWIPIWGGNHFSFFNAIFNVADASITTGVTLLIIYFLFCKKETEQEETPTVKTENTDQI
ncbi:MAG: lipoprotein signal peptidase [Bacteroidales bacterium]|jgi:signal peptidase II|nr:lipoprotein signal peptidase [Bacteroidales bacterium]